MRKMKTFLAAFLVLNSLTLTVFVHAPPFTINNPPVADADGPYEVTVGDTVTLDGSGSYDIDGYLVLWEWDVDNDGTYDATGVYCLHAYSSPGTYTVVLRVTDDDGSTDIDSTTVTVNPEFVVPEYPFGTITFVFASLIALSLFRKRKLLYLE